MSLRVQKILPGQYVLSVYLSVSTTVMNFGGITHTNRLAWEIMLYPKAVPSSCILGETSAHLPPACSFSSKCSSSKGWYQHRLRWCPRPLSLPISASIGNLPRNCSEITWHKGRHLLMRKHRTTSVTREHWILWREEFIMAQCTLIPWLKKSDFSPFSACIQFEQNNVDTARKKSGQLLKQLDNEHLVNGYEDVITNLCQKQGLLVSKVCPCSSRTVPVDGSSDAMVQFRHLPTTSFPNSSDPEHRRHSIPIPLPDWPLHVASQAEPMRWVWLEKGKEKAGECFPLVCVDTCERVIDVQLNHCTVSWSLWGCSIPDGHICSALRGSTGVNK